MKNQTRPKGQINLLDEIIVDNFAGGGGASTGIELATGQNVSIAINHDPAAILMHKTNHPHTEHLQDSVWNIDPVEICAGRPVGLAWFSPDCKHFSKAKGAALVDKNIRGLAWIVLKWAGTVRPRVIILENVEEFKTWGPVRKGKPIKARAGETFNKWFSQLEALGYKIEHRELVAADYGAPTTRKRFVLIARCDGKPIVWPERTHAPRDSKEVKSGKCKPWVSAAEIIDWSLPCPSIFESTYTIKEKYGLKAMRPLKDNTLRRIARGMDKFVIKSQKPFIIPIGYGERKGQAPRVNDIDNPVGTVVGTVKHNVVDPVLTPYALNHKFKNGPESLERPLSTITAVNGHEVVMPTLTQYFKGDHYHSPEDPLHTVTTEIREGVTLAHLTEFKGQDIGQDVNNPLRTIMTKDVLGVVTTWLEKINGFNDLKFWPQVREMLNAYCGYNIAEDEILILTIGGINYFISDIGLRMLTPAELYRAQGFPEDYIIDHDYTGKPYPKSQQVARCGNAVCPPMAKAVVAVNLPEYCIADLSTMAAFTNHMAV